MRTPLTFATLNSTNRHRCEQVFHPINEWTPSDWGCALAGECGEVCDAVKKLRRLDHNTNTAKDPQTVMEAVEDVALELADVVIYADLLASRLGIDLGDAVIRKFNATSKLRGSTIFLEKQ